MTARSGRGLSPAPRTVLRARGGGTRRCRAAEVAPAHDARKHRAGPPAGHPRCRPAPRYRQRWRGSDARGATAIRPHALLVDEALSGVDVGDLSHPSRGQPEQRADPVGEDRTGVDRFGRIRRERECMSGGVSTDRLRGSAKKAHASSAGMARCCAACRGEMGTARFSHIRHNLCNFFDNAYHA